MSKVVHLSNEAHADAKLWCKARGLKMSDWVGSLILEAIAAEVKEEEVAPVEETQAPRKKALPRLDEQSQAGNDGTPVYSQPPFWASVAQPNVEDAEMTDEADESDDTPATEVIEEGLPAL